MREFRDPESYRLLLPGVVRMKDWVQEEETVSRYPKSAKILILSSKLLTGSISLLSFKSYPCNSIIVARVGWGIIFVWQCFMSYLVSDDPCH